MKNAAVFTALAASAAVVSAQVTFENGTYTCAKPNAAYCSGDSLSSDIIIRCDADGKGQPGRCTDNLAGEPPLGVNPALCYQSDATAGDAACEKNCVVYASSSFTLPASVCTPSFTASGSATATGTGTTVTTTATGGNSYPASSAPVTSTSTVYPTQTGGGGGSYPTGAGNATTSGGSGVPRPPPTTGGPSSLPTTAGAAKTAVGGFAVLGLAVAALLA